jgi:hypothetical protein
MTTTPDFTNPEWARQMFESAEYYRAETQAKLDAAEQRIMELERILETQAVPEAVRVLPEWQAYRVRLSAALNASTATTELEDGSPNHMPQALRDFAASGYKQTVKFPPAKRAEAGPARPPQREQKEWAEAMEGVNEFGDFDDD